MVSVSTRLSIKDYGPQWRLFLLTLVGFAIRIAFVGDHDSWWDEIVTATRAQLPIGELLTSLWYQSPSTVITDCSPPLHHIIIHYSLLLGKTDFFLKLPNVIFGALTMPAFYALFSRLFGERVGWYSAIFVCFSFFHVSYSRDARWYSLFLLCSACAFLFYLKAIDSNRVKHWAGFVLFAVAMSYTGYTSATYIISLCVVFVAWFALVAPKVGRHRSMVLKSFIISLFCVLVLYAPWLGGQYNAFLAFRMDNIVRPFDLYELVKMCSTFLWPYFSFNPGIAVFFCCVSLLGLVSAYLRRTYFSLFALLLWVAIPVVAAYKAKIGFAISPKYIISVMYFVAAMVGFVCAGAEHLVNKACSRWCWTWVPSLAGAVVAVVISLPSIANMNSVYITGAESSKAFLPWMLDNKFNTEILLLNDNYNTKAIMDWYEKGVFGRIDLLRKSGYNRCLFVGAGELPDRKDVEIAGVHIQRVGILDRSPLYMHLNDGVYTYSDNFHSLKAYSDAFTLDNMSVSLQRGLLSPYDITRSGSATYRFVNVTGSEIGSVKLNARLDLSRTVGITSNSEVIIVVSSGKGDHVYKERVNETSFDPASSVLDVSLEPKMHLAADDFLDVTFQFVAGEKPGPIQVSSFELVCTSQNHDAGAQIDTSELYARNIAKRTNVVTYDGVPRMLDKNTLYMFDMTDERAAQMLPSFLSRFPGIHPVYTLNSDNGAPRFLYYDPGLDFPYYQVAACTQQKVSLGVTGKLPGYSLTGNLSLPRVCSDAGKWDVLMQLPYGSRADIVPGGLGRIVLEPLFMDGGIFPLQFDSFNDIRKPESQNFITCRSDKPCAFSYKFSSAYPLTKASIALYPRVFSDQKKENAVKVRFLVNGKDSQDVYTFQRHGDNAWRGDDLARITRTFREPVTSLEVIFELSGDGAQVLSNYTPYMRIVLDVDTRLAPQIVLPDSGIVWVEGDRANDLGMMPLKALPPSYDSYRRTRYLP